MWRDAHAPDLDNDASNGEPERVAMRLADEHRLVLGDAPRDLVETDGPVAGIERLGIGDDAGR